MQGTCCALTQTKLSLLGFSRANDGDHGANMTRGTGPNIREARSGRGRADSLCWACMRASVTIAGQAGKASGFDASLVRLSLRRDCKLLPGAISG